MLGKPWIKATPPTPQGNRLPTWISCDEHLNEVHVQACFFGVVFFQSKCSMLKKGCYEPNNSELPPQNSTHKYGHCDSRCGAGVVLTVLKERTVTDWPFKGSPRWEMKPVNEYTWLPTTGCTGCPLTSSLWTLGWNGLPLWLSIHYYSLIGS